jgi:hypothetical protein
MALVAGEQTGTVAVSPAMLAVTSLRHLYSRAKNVRCLAHAFLTGYGAQRETRGATGGRSMPWGLALQRPSASGKPQVITDSSDTKLYARRRDVRSLCD